MADLPPRRTTMNSEPRFYDDVSRLRYQLLVDDVEVGFIEYDRVGETSILIKHTEVHPGHEGRGLGSKILRAALDRIREQGRTVIPICPYALEYIRRHPEYHDIVREEIRRTL